MQAMSADPFKSRIDKPRSKEALVLSQSRLNQLIQNSRSDQDEKEREKARLEDRRQRQEATKALSKLIMQRKEPGSELRKRQYAQDIKMASMEMEREKRTEARKNFVLDMAYKRLYEETDRVKYFKTAKNLSEMLKQRDMQLEAKANMVDLFSKYDKEFVLGMIRDVDNYAREEAEKVDKVIQDRKKNAENWSKQIEEVQKKRKEEEWNLLRDGLIVREEAQNYLGDLRKREIEERGKTNKYKSNLDQQRRDKLVLTELYSKLDEAEDKRAAIFNEAKRDMKIKHKEVKEKLDKQKALKRQHVANNLRDESTALKAKEQAILQKAILQADAKNEEESAIKQAEREEALKSIQEFYEKEMEAKARREREEKIRGFQERRKILEHVEDLLQAEDSKTEHKKKSEKETQHTQLHQIAKKQMDKQAERAEDRNDYLNHIRSLDDEEEIFQRYAQMEIEDCEARGLNTRPMRFAARPGIECGKGPLHKHRGHIRPRYYSALSQGDELNHTDRAEKRPDTKSRLGFVLH